MTLDLAQNSGKTARGKPFKRGHDARRNRGGRPKGLAGLVSQHTNDGAELVQFYADIFHRAGEFEGAKIPLPTRMEAANWLADRRWGKPAQRTELTGADGQPLEERRVLEVVAVDYRITAQPLLTDGGE